MPDPLCAFVGQGAALTAAAWAAAAANADGGGPFQRLGEGRGAALREAWTADGGRRTAVHSKAGGGGRRRRAVRARPSAHEEGEARGGRAARRAAPGVGRCAEGEEAEGGGGADGRRGQAALLAPLAAADTTASLEGARKR